MKVERKFNHFDSDMPYDLRQIRVPIRIQRGYRDKLMNDEVSVILL